ncbi:MAG TPA: A24 family peptidase [Acidimicrobiales bacterium]|nr:A24 family peptidase [Acidimicrobiales bacterium]
MTVALAVACAVLGLYVGLYLNLAIDLVPKREPMRPVRGGCRNCLEEVRPTSQVPLVPWLFRSLRSGHAGRGRRCGVCGARVSVRYPVVEVACAGLLAAAALRLGVDAALPAFLVFFACLLVVSVIDLEYSIIPNRIVYPTIFVSVPLLAVAALVEDDLGRLVTALAGAAIAFAVLFVVHLLSPASMGFGDVRLTFILGLFLGWLSLSHVVVGLFLGFLLGAVVGVGLVLTRRRGRKDSVPFGPFLAGGAALAVLFGRPLINWWLRA